MGKGGIRQRLPLIATIKELCEEASINESSSSFCPKDTLRATVLSTIKHDRRPDHSTIRPLSDTHEMAASEQLIQQLATVIEQREQTAVAPSGRTTSSMSLDSANDGEGGAMNFMRRVLATKAASGHCVAEEKLVKTLAMALPEETARLWLNWFTDGKQKIGKHKLKFKVHELLHADAIKIAKILFDVLDGDKVGKLSTSKAAEGICLHMAQAAAAEGGDKSLEKLLLRFMEAMDANKDGYIDYGEWMTIAERCPDFFAQVPSPLHHFLTASEIKQFDPVKASQLERQASELSKSQGSWCQRVGHRCNVDTLWKCWLFLWWTVMFAYQFWHVAADAKQREKPAGPTQGEPSLAGPMEKDSFGWGYVVARAAGFALNPMCFCLLLPILVETLVSVMHSPARYIIPNDPVKIHKITGMGITAMALVHTVGHVINYVTRWKEFTLWQHLSSQDEFRKGWTGLAGITGVLLIVILLFMVAFARSKVRHSGWFKWFQYTHYLWLPWIVCLFLHAPSCWKWMIAPVGLYLLARLQRQIQGAMTGRSQMNMKLEALPANCTRVEIVKPKNFHYSAGMWVRIKVPSISNMEWHPFTVSSAPEESGFFTLHVKAAGDWTQRLYEIAKEVSGTSLRVKVEGPFAAPADEVWNTEHPILIAAGIGITPFASILNSIAVQHSRQLFSERLSRELFRLAMPPQLAENDDMRRAVQQHIFKDQPEIAPRHVSFFWVNRDEDPFTWFAEQFSQIDVNDRLLSSDGEPLIDYNLYMTGQTDSRSASQHLLVRLAMEACTNKLPASVSHLSEYVNPGRPDWREVLKKTQKTSHGRAQVFFCGPKALGLELERVCNDVGLPFYKENF